MMLMSIEDHIGIGDPLKEGDIQVKVEGHLNKEDIWIEDLLGEDIPNRGGRPPRRGGYPGGGPSDGGGPLEDGGPLDPPVDEDHQALKDPLGQ